MADIEMSPIHNQGSNRCGSPTASDPKHRSDPSLGKNSADEDIGQTPTSSVPLLSSLETCHSGRESLFISIWQWGLVFLVPTITIAYLAFCYVVHYRVVPAKVAGLSADSTTEFLSEHSPPTQLGIMLTLSSQRWICNNYCQHYHYQSCSVPAERDSIRA